MIPRIPVSLARHQLGKRENFVPAPTRRLHVGFFRIFFKNHVQRTAPDCICELSHCSMESTATVFTGKEIFEATVSGRIAETGHQRVASSREERSSGSGKEKARDGAVPFPAHALLFTPSFTLLHPLLSRSLSNFFSIILIPFPCHFLYKHKCTI